MQIKNHPSIAIKIISRFNLAVFCCIAFGLASSVHAQDVEMTGLSIQKTDKGFLVKGSVTGSGLNPKGQIVEDDSVSIIAEIKMGTSSVYPVLPESFTYVPPAGSETRYTKAGRCLTKKEYEGENIKAVAIAGFPLRRSPVWSAYGGLGAWDKSAPGTVTKDFEGIVPLQYEGKTYRIRASLSHVWGGPRAYWSAFSFHHHVEAETVLGSSTGPQPDDPCKKDSDKDGIPDWQDACPNAAGEKARGGCPPTPQKFEDLRGQDPQWAMFTRFGENRMREQLRGFLQCIKDGSLGPGFNRRDFLASADSLKFRYDESCTAPRFEPATMTICLPQQTVWKTITWHERSRQCMTKGQIDEAANHYDSIYHEFGHLIANRLQVDRVSGAGCEHAGTWARSESAGCAFDEGRADFINYLLSKATKNPVKNEWGRELANKNLPRDDRTTGGLTEGAVTSFLIDLLPQDSCEALDTLVAAHRNASAVPQSIGDWVVGYETLFANTRPIREAVAADMDVEKKLKIYHIEAPLGHIASLTNVQGVTGYSVNADGKSIGLNSAIANAMTIEGPRVSVDVATRLGNLRVTSQNTLYEIKIAPDGKVTIISREGTVRVKPPDDRKVLVRESESYTWPESAAETPEAIVIRAEEANLKDVDVYEFSYLNWNNANWGAYQFMTLGSNVTGLPNTRRRICIWFDPNVLRSIINESSKVELQLSHWTYGQTGKVSVKAYRVLDAWQEGEGTYHPGVTEASAPPGVICWNRQPRLDTSRVWANSIVSPGDGPYSIKWDITELVNGWLSGKIPNYGLALIGEGEGTASFSHTFASSENADEALKPRLVITRRH